MAKKFHTCLKAKETKIHALFVMNVRKDAKRFFFVNFFVGELAYPNLMLLAILLTSIEKQRIGNQMNSIAWETDHPHDFCIQNLNKREPTNHIEPLKEHVLPFSALFAYIKTSKAYFSLRIMIDIE